jgi:hypothetical protein
MIPDRKYLSRAAIRALLLRRSALSDDDLDALVIYAGA